jgi:thiol-disulfide isomerase/thioredoxin
MSHSQSVGLFLWPVLGLWAIGCGTASTPSESNADAAAPSSASDVAERRPSPPSVDATKPMALDSWRAVQAEALAAIAEPDAAKKIVQCREFVAKHGAHPEAANVIDGLFEALGAQGEPDKAELATLARKRVALEPNGHERPFELLREVHLEHTLPVAEADAMIAVAKERLVQEAEDAELESNEEYKQYMRLAVKQGELELATLEARIHLAHGDGKRVLEVLARARELGDAMAKHVVAFAADGEPVKTFRTGAFDTLSVLEAAAHRKLGDDAAARAALAQVVGFVSDLKLRKLYDETREQLGDVAKPMLAVRGEPELAQAFALENLDGKTTKLTKYKGKVVLVAFWATWCGPCKKELPHLQKFAKDNAKKGVELLTISIDDFASRSKIKPFLASNRLDLEVLFEDPKQLSGYDYAAIPALYVIDRDGKIAHARTGYDRDLDDKLAHEIKDVVDGKPSQGRDLVTLEQAPEGWKVLWQTPVMGDIQAVAISAPVGKAQGEVGIVGREGFGRWSVDGRALPGQPLTGWARALRTSDLDADGKREWIVGGWQDVKVLDDAGKLYWERAADGLQFLVGLRDLDGDGFEEIIVRSENRVMALKADSKEMWRSRPFARIESVHIGPSGEVLVQADGDLVELDARGAEKTQAGSAARRPAPEGRNLSGRTQIDGKTVDVFEAKFDASPQLRYDLDADGRNDVVVVSEQGIIAYDGAGTPMLELRTHENDMTAAIGNLDGKPGDEIALAIRHYGVVVLGRPES